MPRPLRSALVGLAFCLSALPASAQDAEKAFFAGKTVRIVVGSATGVSRSREHAQERADHRDERHAGAEEARAANFGEEQVVVARHRHCNKICHCWNYCSSTSFVSRLARIVASRSDTRCPTASLMARA